LKQKYDGDNWESEFEKKVVDKVNNFTIVPSKLWAKSNSTLSRFRYANNLLLEKEFIMPADILQAVSSYTENFSVGSPQKPFVHCSDRTKRRKIAPLMKSYFCHKILLLSEDAQEARNKYYRKIRQHNTRKMSRLQQNKDLIHMLLVSSDPYVSIAFEMKLKQKKYHLDEDKKSLIYFDSNNSESSSKSNSNSDSE